MSEPSNTAQHAERVRQRFAMDAPTSQDLTPQQWYNVCKYAPHLAKRCNRPMADVGPHNPLDRTARAGIMFAGTPDPEATAEQQAQALSHGAAQWLARKGYKAP